MVVALVAGAVSDLLPQNFYLTSVKLHCIKLNVASACTCRAVGHAHRHEI